MRNEDSFANEGHPPLPATLRLLCVGSDEPSWVSLTMQLSARGCDEPQFRWSSTAGEAVTILRHQIFDCLIVSARGRGEGELFSPEQTLRLVEAIRSSGHDEPVILLVDELDETLWERLASFECEIVVTRRFWDSPALLPMIVRAVKQIELSREFVKLRNEQHRRRQQDKTEAEGMLEHQRQLLRGLTVFAGRIEDATSPARAVPGELREYYRQLLRASVMMGDGSLSAEIHHLAELLAECRYAPREVFALHLAELDAIRSTLGHRSARHAVTRAGLLFLELVLSMCEPGPPAVPTDAGTV